MNQNGFGTVVVWNGNDFENENVNENMTETYRKSAQSRQGRDWISPHTFSYRLLLGDLEQERDLDLERDLSLLAQLLCQ